MKNLYPEPNGMAKLSETEVRHIRYLLDTKQATAAELARDHGLSAETVRRIGRRETWAWVKEAPKLKEAEWKAAADASLEKLLAANPDIAATLKMSAAIKEARGVAAVNADTLVEELKGETNERKDG